MSIVPTTPELVAEWEPTAGIVTCSCGMAIIADNGPNVFSREIVFHAMTHSTRPAGSEGVSEFAKFLRDTSE